MFKRSVKFNYFPGSLLSHFERLSILERRSFWERRSILERRSIWRMASGRTLYYKRFGTNCNKRGCRSELTILIYEATGE